MLTSERASEKVAQIVRDAGGQIIGRTRLQKLAYLLEVSGLGAGFAFKYKHYGPYSEDLANAAESAHLVGTLEERQCQTDWGGFYSIYSVVGSNSISPNAARVALASLAVDADPVELELAATAVFLSRDGFDEPWLETLKRKPEKATDLRLKRAKELYKEMLTIRTPTPLPRII